MWKKAEIDIFREVDSTKLATFENADAEDGIMLNHNYVDMRGIEVPDAKFVIEEEAALLNMIASEGVEEVDRIIDELTTDGSELGGFDVGVAGAIFALSAAGAAPITSCNGGLLDEYHSSRYPHVLFSVALADLHLIATAAEDTDVGLGNAVGHVEVYADSIPRLNAFAARLIGLLENSRSARF